MLENGNSTSFEIECSGKDTSEMRVSAVSNKTIEKQGVSPLEKRHCHTQKETDKGMFRVVSYNTLADIWVQRDYEAEFSYCPPYAISIDYRQKLLIKELQGYNADILCLQEVDNKAYHEGLSNAMQMTGFLGRYKQKAFEDTEGSAIFYRNSKFKLIAEHGDILKDILEKSDLCSDILRKTYSIQAMRQRLKDTTQLIHVLVLEALDEPGHVVVAANTHLYWHETGEHVRLVQIIVIMRYLEDILGKFKEQNASLFICGDFNSRPDQGVYEFLTTQQIKEDSKHWKDGGLSQFVPEMSVSQSLCMGSGCGQLPYTNYTADYQGHLDFIYYDLDHLEVAKVIPPPEHEHVIQNTALPSVEFPSDHIAQICDFKFK